MVAHVVKRAGHTEPYAEAKVRASLHHAALSVRALEGEAELLAEHVSCGVSAWIEDKVEVTSLDIRRAASRLASDFHPEAAYAYDSHDSYL